MVKEIIEKKVEQKPKVKVLSLSDYIGKVGNNVMGSDKVKAAIVLLYSENKIIDKIDRKGELFFVAEA